MKIDLHDLLKRAYFAGFIDSHDGYNGESPFDGDMRQIARELGQSAELAIEGILRDVDATAEARPPTPVVTDALIAVGLPGDYINGTVKCVLYGVPPNHAVRVKVESGRVYYGTSDAEGKAVLTLATEVEPK